MVQHAASRVSQIFERQGQVTQITTGPSQRREIVCLTVHGQRLSGSRSSRRSLFSLQCRHLFRRGGEFFVLLGQLMKLLEQGFLHLGLTSRNEAL